MRLWSRSVPTCVEAESTDGRNVRKFMTEITSLCKALKVIEYDGCEYLLFGPYSYAGLLTHKGNCKYCEQRRNKQNENRKSTEEERNQGLQSL